MRSGAPSASRPWTRDRRPGEGATATVDALRSSPRVPARLAAVSSTVVALGAGAHVAGSGAVPDGSAVLALGALTVAAAVPLARRRLQVTTLLPGVAAWQWLMHQALAATTPLPGAPPAGPSGHAAHAAATAHPAAGAPHPTSAAMTAAHVLTTVLTVALLIATERGAERALRRWTWALPVLTGARVLPVVTTAPQVLVHGDDRRSVPRASTGGAYGSRAPPAGVPLLSAVTA